MSIKVSPSILSANLSRLKEEILSVEEGGADYLHLDVMDGVFVPNLTFGPVFVKAVSQITILPLETHLMIIDPLKYIKDFVEAGSHIIIFHIESLSPIRETIKIIRSFDRKPGLSLNPHTPIEILFPFIGEIDWVLVMGVNPGFAGQSFNKEVLKKIETLREIKDREKLDYTISVDGGINRETGLLAKEAGAEVLVSASFIFNSPDRKRAIEDLKR
jgi:ribulose-phosphate 3-epimerase